MGKYEGLSEALKNEIYVRDQYRCRWCGSPNHGPYDVHHITYRRGESDDRPDNLILLCRTCHNFVHDSYRIPKGTAQRILRQLITTPGKTGRQLARWEDSRITRLGDGPIERVSRFFDVGSSDGGQE
jgi:HNH endonuclease